VELEVGLEPSREIVRALKFTIKDGKIHPGPELNRTFAGALQLADGSIRHSAIEGATSLLYLRRISLTRPSLAEKICP